MTSDSKNNDDIKQHLINLESRLDRLSVPPHVSFDAMSVRHEDEIDLREIWSILWEGKWWIVGITFLFAIGSIIFALSLPNRYKAETVLAPAQEQAGGLGSLAAQYGGLAAMAGINLRGGQNSDVDQAVALLKSWPFLNNFVEKYDLKPLVIAVQKWDAANDKIVYDDDIYDPDTKQWLREPKPNRPAEPTSFEVYETLAKMIAVNQDVKTGLIRLSVEHYIPRLAYEWNNLLVNEINWHFQQRDIVEASQNMDYLKAKVNETSIAEMQSVFYRMIEAQMKTLMLAEVSDEYLLKTAVPATLPERKSSPKRMMLCILGVVLGGMLGIIAVFFLRLRARNSMWDGESSLTGRKAKELS